MRKFRPLVWLFIGLALTTVAISAAPANDPSTIRREIVAVGSSTNASASVVRSDVIVINSIYAAHRGQIVAAAQAAQRVRENWAVGGLALLIFLIVSAPAKLKDISKYFNAMTSNSPLPWFKQAGIKGEDLTNTRRVLFFYTLFLLYEIVSYPLMRWNDSAVAFYSDLLIQIVIITFLFGAFGRLRDEINRKWPDDAYRRAHVRKWFAQKIDDMRLRFSDMRRLALVGLAGAFLPAVVANLPKALDYAVQADVSMLSKFNF